MDARRSLWLFALSLAGCALDFGAAVGRCFIPEDCPLGQTCELSEVAGEGFCVGGERDNPLAFAIDISPPLDSKLLRRQEEVAEAVLVAPITDLLDLPLETAVTVQGQVSQVGAPELTAVLVRATNVAEPLIAGTSRELFEAVSNAAGVYELSVRPGVYDIVAIPLSDSTLPVVVRRGVELPDPSGAAPALVFDGTRLLRGKVEASVGGQLQGLAGMRVIARVADPVTLDADAELRSADALTLADGSFAVALPDQALDAGAVISLHIEPDATGPNALIPAADLPFVMSQIPADAGGFDLGVVDLGVAEAAVLFSGRVTGLAADQDADPATVLTFTRTAPKIPGRTFSRRVEISDGGVFEADLLPGTYDVRVASPTSSELASAELTGIQASSCGEPQCPLLLSLPGRHTVFGQIFGAGDGLPVEASFVVDARPAGRPDLAVVGSSFVGPGELYTLTLDPGLYDLTFTPSSENGLGAWFLFGVDLTVTDAREELFLPPPSLMTGRVLALDILDGMDLPAAGATVRVFARSADGAHYLASTSTTFSNGRFVSVLPNPSGLALELGPLTP
jgi:hypothetical protein